MSKQYDIVIAGGGMVGLSLACALGNSVLQVAIIEKQASAETAGDSNYDNRVSAITLACRNFLEHIGAWSAIVQQRHHPYQKMLIWDAAGQGELEFDCADIGEACLGYIIENRVTQSALQQQLQNFSNITYYEGCDIIAVDELETETVVHCRNDEELHCKLLVAADGAQSLVRQLSGISSYGWSYQQQAIVATVETEKPHQDTAWQRFLPSGPLAFLPLDDEHHCSIVWSIDNDKVEELTMLDDDAFCLKLQSAFDNRLGVIRNIEERKRFPLNLAHASEYVQSRLALIGDAAHRVHPLAGQGVNLGFADAATLAEVILEALKSGKDIGAYNVLRRFERWRKGDNIAMLAATDVLKRLFGTDQVLISTLRSLGMNAVNAASPVKDIIMRSATGLVGDLPLSMRP
jgi:2-octaprenylphenol hydroxylase